MSATRRPVSLARRALPALTLAGAGGLLLLELDHPSAGAPGLASGSPPLRATASATPPGTTPPTVAASNGSSSAAGAGTVPSTVPAAPQTCSNDVVGPTVATRWGPVQVEALVSSDGRVCDIQALQSPDSERRSISINRQALPILHDRAVESSSSFDAVTGATVTSEGYRASLQAILDGR